MHPNAAFRQVSDVRSLAFARDRAFGTLIVGAAGAEGMPMISHLPFLLCAAGALAEMHLVRSKPIARLDDGPALLCIAGDDADVSPDWSGIAERVPTWNYVAVHLRGRLERLPDRELRDPLDRLGAAREAGFAPKTLWTTAKMTQGVLDRIMRQVVPVRLRIDKVQAP